MGQQQMGQPQMGQQQVGQLQAGENRRSSQGKNDRQCRGGCNCSVSSPIAAFLKKAPHNTIELMPGKFKTTVFISQVFNTVVSNAPGIFPINIGIETESGGKPA